METTDLLRLAKARQLSRTGEALAIRLRSALGLQEVAEAAGITANTLRTWEQGSARPRGERALRWLDVLEALRRDVEHARSA
jgi:DNA-binding transcriptional regulator YiaG